MRKTASDGGQQASSIRWVMGLIPKETLATLYILSLNITPATGEDASCVLTVFLRPRLLLPGCESPGVMTAQLPMTLGRAHGSRDAHMTWEVR